MKKRIFGIILILIGIGILGWVGYMKYTAYNVQKQMINDFQKTLQQIDTNPNSDAKSKDSSGDSLNASKPGDLNPKAIAIMEIPKIDLTVAVAEGVSNDVLKYALGHFPGTGQPGQKGNFCVAGHRSYTYNEYLNRADEIKVGDQIKVRTQKGEFTYVVYETKVVEPTEVSVLDPTSDSTITLVTCTPIRIATHRLIIKGRLKA
ncbi:class D sortase [Clostridium sp. 19966]|uniref:class D sortase n=1 Tax=Clostridium sp. 19966 TaxID=2768166 RepID=UPI0028DD6043|nr:class D sortase [Clostridium sp. 19966]MDT8717303.1 class D sortase [Clostridium sp. 19966]